MISDELHPDSLPEALPDTENPEPLGVPLSLPQPGQEVAADPASSPDSEPLGIQEASVQTLIEEERAPLIERVEDGEQESASHSEIDTRDSLPLPSLEERVAELQQQEQALKREIATLEATRARLQEETLAAQGAIAVAREMT